MITIKLELIKPDIFQQIAQLEQKGYHKIAIEDNKTMVLRKYRN